MAPQELPLPGTRPTATSLTEGDTVDEDILVPSGHPIGEGEQEDGRESTSCLYCLEGWVFLGSLDHDGKEIVEAIRCRRCKGTGLVTC